MTGEEKQLADAEKEAAKEMETVEEDKSAKAIAEQAANGAGLPSIEGIDEERAEAAKAKNPSGPDGNHSEAESWTSNMPEEFMTLAQKKAAAAKKPKKVKGK